jgi:hypothetical protein
MEKGEFGFEGQIQLDAWRGFQNRRGTSGSADAERMSDGTCRLATGGDMADDNPEIKDYHIKAYSFLLDHQEKIKEYILDRLMKEYRGLQSDYGYHGEEKDERMPDISSKNDFKELIGLSNIHLMNVEKDGIGYVGYEFGCSWDTEHGLGVMTYKDKIIQLGGADVAFLSWVARKDQKPVVEEEGPGAYRLTDDNFDLHNRKPWWKFW